MTAFAVTYKMKDLFFDRAAVAAQMSRATRKALSKAGAFIRTRARSRLRRRKRPSAPGESPSIHARDRVASLKNILFAYEPQTESVVVGPVGLNRRGPLVPQLMEFGGSAKVTQVRVGGAWLSGVRRRRPGQPVRVRSAQYAARPFMGPALEAEQANIPRAWAGTLGG